MNETTYNLFNLIAAYLSAVGTIAAVVVALFLQVFIVRRRRPQLTVRLTLEGGVPATEAWTRRSTGTVNCWLGVRVEARRGRDAARNVRAYLLKVARPALGADVGNYPAAALDWANSGGAEAIQIPSGTGRPLTLLRYIAATSGREPQLMPTTMVPVREPYDERYLLSAPGEYALIFEISADGVDPTIWKLSFDHRTIDVADDNKLMQERLKNVRCDLISAEEISQLDL